MKTTIVLVIVAAAAAANVGGSSRLAAPAMGQGPVPATPCPRCGWVPPVGRAVHIRTASELEHALASSRADDSIVLADGEYMLTRMLDIATPRVTVRGGSGDRTAVVLRGEGIDERRVGVAISVSAPDVTIADLTIGRVAYHGVQVRGERGASRFTMHGVRITDTGQQLLKGSTDGGPLHADNGLVACSEFDYTDHAPSDYTNGVDVLGGRGWTVRDSGFRHIRGPGGAAGPAILFWANAQDTVVERNTIIDSFRGIAFGLGPGASHALARDGEAIYDHQGGAIRHNAIVNLHPWGDEGIEANAVRGVRIERNSVMTAGQVPWSISVRFRATTAEVRDNLTSRPVVLRDGATARMERNVLGATPAWFVDAGAGDLRLVPGAPAEPGSGAFPCCGGVR